ncbi:helix-turn-helix transcriptional regulator [Streptomyces sp. NPDC088341]|uniref:helix-turn-helix domain-containing protein n=1 Tax=Streptomyces sp. NPDC088341 TaxID=3154870 RepID=UPI0034473820
MERIARGIAKGPPPPARGPQEAVALRVDMALAQYNRIEKAHASPLPDTLIRVADAIGVPLSLLVREEPRPGLGARTGQGGRAGQEPTTPDLLSECPATTIRRRSVGTGW